MPQLWQIGWLDRRVLARPLAGCVHTDELPDQISAHTNTQTTSYMLHYGTTHNKICRTDPTRPLIGSACFLHYITFTHWGRGTRNRNTHSPTNGIMSNLAWWIPEHHTSVTEDATFHICPPESHKDQPNWLFHFPLLSRVVLATKDNWRDNWSFYWLV